MIGEAQDEIFSREEIFASQNLSDAFSPSVIIIETRALIRECLAMCLQKKLGLPILTYPDVASWSQDPTGASACVIILSGVDKQIEAEQSELIRELSQWEKEVPVVLFSDNESRSHIANSLRSGAKGYIPSDTPLEVVARAIKLVLVGGVFVPANAVMETRPEESNESIRCDAKFDFTVRENDVVKALLKGKSNKVIAYELSMSESSVKVHIRNVMRKLQVRNRTEAVIRIAEIVRGQTGQQEETPTSYCA
ncbi:response regulator transcription factor [Methylocystis sp. Sn-Cys]|uniref:response regulator transcription factor n=1 Tax=Methylocystis sp. Sn-Cys TaxID=1701263 RepID=UPI0019227AB3|nr:response regulator transcription factor [Methylocystis sp. Sn-Cys]MBL1258392.1 response regulator transcription factor [Methylocystis sp. Sn-Cys]